MAKVTASLLADLTAGSWYDSHVRTSAGQDRWFRVDTIANTWVLGASGSGAFGIAPADFAKMQGGTAQTDGSWLDVAGAQWHLTANGTGGPGSMVACDSGPPPSPG